MPSTQTVRNIQKISFIFFICLGILHLVSGLAVPNGYFPDQAGVANRALFIPFAVAALLYAGSSIEAKLLLQQKDPRIWHYVWGGFSAIVIIGMLILEFLPAQSA